MKKVRDGKTVVVADDDRYIVDSLTEALGGTDHEVVGEAANGLDLIKICEEKRPDIVIVDIQMPVMDGIAATKKLIEGNLAKCIIVLTSFADTKYVQGAIDAGASGYLTKPIDKDVLIPTITTAFQESCRLYDMNRKVTDITRRRETREIIEKAQLMLMEKNGMSEADAYGYIKGLSKEQNRSMAEIAEIVIAKGAE